MSAIICEKCLGRFYKKHRYDKHVAGCKGKICRVCGERGHLSCGTTITGTELLERIKKQTEETGKPVRIVGLFGLSACSRAAKRSNKKR